LKECWRVGKLESWGVEELGSWRVGELESWKVGEKEGGVGAAPRGRPVKEGKKNPLFALVRCLGFFITEPAGVSSLEPS
jgi:hypothetical protein